MEKIIKQKRFWLYLSFGFLGLLLLVVIPTLLLARQKKSKAAAESYPSPIASANPNHEAPWQTISYYVTTSQELLNKGRHLSQNQQQSVTDKKEIIEIINQALDVINQGIANYPNDDRVFSQRASIYSALVPFLPESANFAIEDLRIAIKLNSQNPQYQQRLAQLYLKQGNFELAALAFYNAHLLSPTEVQTLYQLAETLEKSGQLQKANHFFSKLIGLLPPDDQNLPSIKEKQAQLQALITQAGLQYLAEPGLASFSPEAPAGTTEMIIGTQELPLEQAVTQPQLIIASSEEKTTTEMITSTSINAKSGQGIIPTGKTEITINNQNVANNKQIVIVPVSDNQNQVLALTAKKEGAWFKVGLDKAISFDLIFNWWIID